MKVYRCCGDDEINAYMNNKKYLKEFGHGTNTFKYDKDNSYIHFFLFAECAEHYKKYSHSRFAKYFIECEIPFEILEEYYGYGWYEALIPGYYTPVPEFAIPFTEFDINYISDISDNVKSEWLRAEEWKQYKMNIPKEYLADYETSSFQKGYNEKSILEIPRDDLIGHINGHSTIVK